MKSLWEKDLKQNEYKELEGDIITDVLVIGGGLAGILCAYELKQRHVDVVLVEADRICCGITQNTTAKITSQHGLIYDKILQEYGEDHARMYYVANEQAIKKYSELCAHIDCDFERKDSYVYAMDDCQKIEQELRALEQIGHPKEFVKELDIPLSVAGAVKFTDQAQFNPCKFVTAIAQELRIYEHTMVRKLDGTTAVCDLGVIKAKKVIVATHFPFMNKHGGYFLKMYQHRSYVIALKGAADVHGMYVDESKTGLSFRNYQDVLLLGGGSHRTGKQGGNWEELRAAAKQFYPSSQETACWATQDCMTLDGIPYIGQYSKNTPDVYVATGFNKWGMTSSMVAAGVLSDLVMGQYNQYEPLFLPSRSSWHSQLAANLGVTLTNFLMPVTRRCTHLGCALHWNPQEHSWDCACHGSRYEEDGTLINNPAMKDAKV